MENYLDISFLATKASIQTRDPIIQNILRERRRRRRVLSKAIHFSAGDVFAVIFWKRSYIYRFEGICISRRKKSLLDPDAALILRNVLLGVGIESTISYYYSRVYKLHILDYKRKKFIYKRAKLYYIRQRINRASRVK